MTDELKPPPMSDEHIVAIAQEHGLGVDVPDAGYKTNMLWFDGDKTDFTLAVIAARDQQWSALVAELQRDAARYAAWFDAGLPITFLGIEYTDKASLDAAIDAARGEKGGV